MVHSRMAQSPSSSGIFYQGDVGQSHGLGNSHHLSSPFTNSSNLMHGSAAARSNLGPLSGDAVLNSVATSGPSVGASSLVTDANSALSVGPSIQRSDSYMRMPASPMSFTSNNNISISGSSVIDGSNQDLTNSQQQNHRGGSSATSSLPTSRMGQVQLPNGTGLRGNGSFIQDPTISQLQKRPRMEMKQEDILQQQVLQQLLQQRQDHLHLQNPNPQLQALIQQQRIRQQQQQILQSMPAAQRNQLLQQQQHQLQLRQQLQQGMQTASSAAVKRPYDAGVCSRRLMKYLYHQRQRPPENSIAYWRKFVAEYYSPRAKKRWCLSLYDNVGHQSLGVFPQAAMDAWQCDICNSKSGRGFEATFEVLPRLNEIKFSSGVVDELLFLDMPRECRFPSGIMMIEYAKAVQESVYDQLRVVREGQLRIIFTPDLKILSWEFCARRHEELLPRRLVAPQVNQLLQVAQKCQSTISESGPEGVSQQDLQANSNLVVTAGRQLARSLELQSLNDLGFSKRYVRCLQIAEVVNSMKDLMDFCRDQKAGPLEGLKNFPRHAAASKLQIPKSQEVEQMGGGSIQGSADRNKQPLEMQSVGHNGQMGSNNRQMSNRGGALSGGSSAQANNNYQNMLLRQNSMNSNPTNPVKQEPSSPHNQTQPSSFQGPNGVFLTSSNVQQQPQQQQQQRLMNQQQHANQVVQQQILQQLLQDINNSNGGVGTGQGNAGGPASMVRHNGFKVAAAASNSESSVGGGSSVAVNNGYGQSLGHNLHMSEEMLPDISSDFTDSGFFNGDLVDSNMNYGWKG
ncbi:unnamed protein product [Cuscuta epithymum]|uniref:Transcriptional regulator SLK2 n=1 Tax=Cuscuta epithymum TaxID=186058 RepID=A0AAV0EHL8_9ASTE|nr:unnamed protein product [Cuscuta epithymum]